MVRLPTSIQRLPNQNTLITETGNGRAFEVTPEGEIVRQFFNLFRAGPSNIRVASLFALDRISPEPGAQTHVRYLSDSENPDILSNAP